MIRQSVRDLVSLCQYVDEKERIGAGHGLQQACPSGSYRKIKWKLRREVDGQNSKPIVEELRVPSEPTAKQENERPSLAQDLAVNIDPSGSKETCGQSLKQLDEFLDDFTASDIDVSNIRCLPAQPSDPLGVTSIPSKRDGYSVTLCDFESTRILVVFGGRQLRDLTVLLPVTSEVDILKLERVRYIFSNGVYSYNLHTSRWKLHQCSGMQPKERSDHSAVFVAPHFLAVFGGRGRSGLVFEDVFFLSLVDWHWTQLDTCSRPSPRYWHGCCTEAENIFVFGGKSEVQVFDDLQQLNFSRVIQKLQLKYKQWHQQQAQMPLPGIVRLPVSWICPTTVGKPPGPRFGLRMVRIDPDRIAFVGGWRSDPKSKPSQSRCVDVYVLDTMMMVWTRPRYSSHICRLSAPPERFLFNCFSTQRSLVIFGGFTYAHNGETETTAKGRRIHTLSTSSTSIA